MKTAQMTATFNADDTNSSRVACKKCNGTLFQPAVELRMVSAVMSPTGKEGLAHKPVFVCLVCHEPVTV